MSHNQPPSWGPLPYDERDLEAVLCGETDGIAIGLRPVTKTLAALRASPAQSELSGETVARATFRAFAVVGETEPAGPAPSGRPVARPSAPVRARRRRYGSTARTGARFIPAAGAGWAATVIAGCAAAAVVAVAVSGVFPGSGTPPGKQPTAATSSGTAQPSGTGSQFVDGRGRASTAPVPTPASKTPKSNPASMGEATPSRSAAAPQSPAPGTAPTPAATAVDGAKACRQFYSFFPFNASQAAWAAHQKLFVELSALAGSPWNVFSYCAAASHTPPAAAAWPSVGAGSGTGSGPDNPADSGNQGGQGGGTGAPGDTGGQGNSGQGNTGAPGNTGGSGGSGLPGSSGTSGSSGTPGTGGWPNAGNPAAG